MRNWLKRKRMQIVHHFHIIHRGEQIAHVVLYTALAAGMKDFYVLMGGIVAITIVIVMITEEGE